MGLTREIAEKAGIPVVLSGSTELIAAGDAIRFVETLATTDHRILGIEGFRVGQVIVPEMEAIADFSYSDGIGWFQAATRFFEEAASQDLAFEFVFAEHDEN